MPHLTFRALTWLLALSVCAASVAQGAPPPDAAAGVAKMAKAEYDKGNFERAAQLYFEAWQASPGSLVLLFSAAVAAQEGKAWAKAAGYYREFLKAPPADMADRVIRAKAGLALCNQAQADAQEAAANDAASKGDHGLAAALYRSAFTLAPERFALLYKAGRALEAAGLKNDARTTYAELLRIAPADLPERVAVKARLEAWARADGGAAPKVSESERSTDRDQRDRTAAEAKAKADAEAEASVRAAAEAKAKASADALARAETKLAAKQAESDRKRQAESADAKATKEQAAREAKQKAQEVKPIEKVAVVAAEPTATPPVVATPEVAKAPEVAPAQTRAESTGRGWVGDLALSASLPWGMEFNLRTGYEFASKWAVLVTANAGKAYDGGVGLGIGVRRRFEKLALSANASTEFRSEGAGWMVGAGAEYWWFRHFGFTVQAETGLLDGLRYGQLRLGLIAGF